MTILVTGGSGFLGRRVVRILLERGDSVFVPSRVQYDLRFSEQVERLFNDAHPTAVLHLAAHVGGIGANAAQPGAFLYDNALMGLHVLDMARVWRVKKFLAVGTVCSYPKHTSAPFHEDNLWNGYPEETNAPYGIAKRMLLTAGQAYRAQYGLNAICVIPTNLYGPGDNADLRTSHVIPALIRKCQSAVRNGETTVTVWGSGQATRDFLYVDDAAQAIVRALDLYADAEPINLGTGVETSIADLVRLIADLTGFAGKLVFDASRPDGQPRRVLDTSRAESLLGWRATTTLRDGLARCIEVMA